VGAKGRIVIKPTVIYQKTYLDYERLHRTHPHWPLSDLRGMTPRQRRHWLRMGDLRAQQRQRDIERAIQNGMTPVG